jgi:hypothetical protein
MTINVSKVTCETKTTKIEPMSNSKPHAYFTEHLVCVIEKHHKNATRNQKTRAFDPMAQEQDPTTRSGAYKQGILENLCWHQDLFQKEKPKWRVGHAKEKT